MKPQHWSSDFSLYLTFILLCGYEHGCKTLRCGLLCVVSFLYNIHEVINGNQANRLWWENFRGSPGSKRFTGNKFSGHHPTLFLPCFLLLLWKTRVYTPSDCIITIITADDKRGKLEPRGSSAWQPGRYNVHKAYWGIESHPTNSSRAAAAPTSRTVSCGVRGDLLAWPWRSPKPTCSMVLAAAGVNLRRGPSSWAEETLDMLSPASKSLLAPITEKPGRGAEAHTLLLWWAIMAAAECGRR